MSDTIYLASDCDKRLISFFERSGHKVCLVKTGGIIAPPVSCHPDMFMCRLGTGRDAPIVFYDVKDGTSGTGGFRLYAEYPHDIGFNAACTGRYFIHSLDNTAPALLEAARELGMELVNVRQGYTKCSTVIVDEDSVITYDRGIAKACSAAGLDVLTVRPGHVLLPGYDTGFIGGTSGRVGDTVFFNGDLSSHPDFGRIKEFIEKRGLGVKWFEEWPLTDTGSII